MIRRTLLCTAAVGVAVSGLVAFEPDLARGIRDAEELRLVIEVSGLFLAASAALVLGLTAPEDVGPSRDAFLAALLVLAVTNAVFSVVPAVLGIRPSVDRGVAFYPWIASRFVAGGLMLLASAGRPRLGAARTVALAFGVLLVVDLALLAAGTRLAAPITLAADGSTVVSDPPLAAVLLLLPGVLFGAGSWLAARLYVRGSAPLFAWLSVAMALQVFSQVHGLLAPAFLGPTVTTMDLFRTGSWMLLAGGAVAQLRHLYVARSRTAEQQDRDLREQRRSLAAHQRLAEREQDFRAVVTHELATPIAAIRAFTHVLAAPTADDQQRDRAVGGLRAETARLAELVHRIEELRDLDVVGTSTVELRPVAIRPLLDEVRAFATGLPGRSPVRVRAEGDRVAADPVRLGQLLRNLVANAVRYSPADAPIDLVGRRDGDRYLVEVVDRGPGIPVDERSRLLEPYARGSTATDEPGSGLGLYVARRLAEAHGGSLELLDGPDGQGTAVRVTLRRTA